MKQRWWIITDTHFGHKKIAEYCNRPHDYENKIIASLNKMVKTNDTIIHLGDFAFYNIDYWCTIYHEAIKGARSWLILGNHDSKSMNWYLNYFDFVGNGFFTERFGKIIYFSHRPHCDIGYDINIHGHLHNVINHQNEPEMISVKNDKQRLLAIEYTNYAPVLIETFINSGGLNG